ncbi:MAG: hypothetical protein ACE5H4_05120 [Candidatus Thorarchaeota archaeon]
MAINIIPILSPITPEETKSQLVKDITVPGADVLTPEEFLRNAKQKPDIRDRHTYLFVGTGGTEKAVSDFMAQAGLADPIILLSHPGNNSLPAAMETRAYLQQQGMNSRIIHSPLNLLSDMIQEWSRFSEVEDKIRNSRLGIVGNPSFWLVASQVDVESVKQRWGLLIESFSIDVVETSLKEDLEGFQSRATEGFVRDARSNMTSDEELGKAALAAKVLDEFVASAGIDAVSVECFTLLEHTDISGCHALSLLNDKEGLVAGCEGDIPATFTMLVAKALTSKPSFMANVAHVNPDSNKAVFAHCTIATSLADEYDIMSHYESGKSVAIRGIISPQRVTALKVFGRGLSEYWVSGGTITKNLDSDTACRTQIEVQMDEPVDYFLEEPLGNHHIIVLGDNAESFRNFFSFVSSRW